ncbi:hypothetical protein ASG23_13290 [Cellulomonas sp. Leaf395]|nr:hypothetical protein ASG23_13290 [Cellulomonas sp. Leaf395]
MDARLADLERQVRLTLTARNALRDLLAAIPTSTSPPVSGLPATETLASQTRTASDDADETTRPSMVNRLTQFIADSETGMTWKARELATAVYDTDPTPGQVEGIRTYARRLVDRGALVKNSNGSFSKVEVTST